MDIYTQEQYQNFTGQVQLIQNTVEFKKKIIQTNNNIKDYLLTYENYLLNCALDYNISYQPSYIKIYNCELHKEFRVPFKIIHFTQKQYFTIGKINKERINLDDEQKLKSILKEVSIEINEVEIKNVDIDFMHLEVNYEHLFNQKGNSEYYHLLDKIIGNIISQLTKSIIWNFEKKGQQQLKIKCLSTNKHPSMIKVSEKSYNAILNTGQQFKLGIGPLSSNVIQIIEQFNTTIEFLQKQVNQNQKYTDAHYIGIPQGVSLNANLLSSQDQEVKEILNSPVLVIYLKKITKSKYYILIAYEKNQFSIGSSSIDNDIVIEDINASIFQSEIIYKKNINKWEIVDIQSEKGTWLILQKELYYRIDKRTIVKLGKEAFQFKAVLSDKGKRQDEDNLQQQKKIKEQAINQFIQEILIK